MRTLPLAASGLASLLVLAAACEPPPPDSPPQTAPTTSATATPAATAAATGPRVTKVDLAAVGLDEAAIDRSADPCQDFYQFACGNWIAKAQIPADRPMTSRGFIAITDRNEEALRQIRIRSDRSGSQMDGIRIPDPGEPSHFRYLRRATKRA